MSFLPPRNIGISAVRIMCSCQYSSIAGSCGTSLLYSPGSNFSHLAAAIGYIVLAIGVKFPFSVDEHQSFVLNLEHILRCSLLRSCSDKSHSTSTASGRTRLIQPSRTEHHVSALSIKKNHSRLRYLWFVFKQLLRDWLGTAICAAIVALSGQIEVLQHNGS